MIIFIILAILAIWLNWGTVRDYLGRSAAKREQANYAEAQRLLNGPISDILNRKKN